MCILSMVLPYHYGFFDGIGARHNVAQLVKHRIRALHHRIGDEECDEHASVRNGKLSRWVCQ